MMEKNRLSAFFDGEKHHTEVENEQSIGSFSDDQDTLQAWQSYVLTREVMRAETDAVLNWDIAANVAKALEAEPAHSKETSQDANVVSMQQPQPQPAEARKTLPAWFQQFAQVGTAAVVCVAVILGVQQYNTGADMQASSSQPPVLHTIPLSGEAAPVSLTRDAVKPSEAQLNQQRQRVNELLQDFELQRRLNAADFEKLNQEESQ